MGLDDLAKGIIGKSLKTLAAVMISNTAANAQDEEKDASKKRPQIEHSIPLPEKHFKIDGFVAKTEGTAEERKKLAEELFAYVLQHGTPQKDTERIKEILFPIELEGEALEVYVKIITGTYKELHIIIRTPGADRTGASVQMHDEYVSGTPSWNKLPVDEKGIKRPQGFAMQGTNSLANRIYLGILRQLMSKF